MRSEREKIFTENICRTVPTFLHCCRLEITFNIKYSEFNASYEKLINSDELTPPPPPPPPPPSSADTKITTL